MTDQELAQKVKAKYPAYRSLDDATLVAKVREKYPQYGNAAQPQSLGKRVMGVVGRGVDKVGDKITHKLPYLKGSDTLPEIVGQTMGQTAGGMLGGPLGGIAGGALGGAAGTMIGNPLSTDMATNLLSLHFPKARQDLENRLGRSMKRGATFSAAGEAVPLAWRGAKAFGREMRGGVAALSGVTDRVEQLGKLPLWEQIKVLNPFQHVPKPDVAGAAQGALEKKLGIPTLKESVTDRILSEPTKKAAVGRTQVSATEMLASKNLTPKARTLLESKFPAKAAISPRTGESTPAMRSVLGTLAKKAEPSVRDAVQALRDIHFRVGKLLPGTPEGAAYADMAEKINMYLESKIKALMDARHITHLAHLRDELAHILPQAPMGVPYRFGVQRLVWMARAAVSMATSGLMAPYMTALASTSGNLATKALDPLLSHPALMGGAVAGTQKLLADRKKKP